MVTNYEKSVAKLPTFPVILQPPSTTQKTISQQQLTTQTTDPLNNISNDNQIDVYDKTNSSNNNLSNNSLNSNPLINLSNLCSNILSATTNNETNNSLNPCLYNDIKYFKEKFGKYAVYNKQLIDGEDWINALSTFLKNKYLLPSKFILYFYLFIDEEFTDWYTEAINNTDWNLFVQSFIDENQRLVFKYNDSSNFVFTVFLKELISDFKNDEKKVKKIKDSPIFNYFKYKIKILDRVKSCPCKEELIKRAIFLIDVIDLKKKFYTYRKIDNILDILEYCKFLDKQKAYVLD